ncbi:MAG: hypothetical protein ACI350_00900 [Prevotella sp.]
MINPCKVYVTADMTDGGMFVFNSGGTEGTVCPSWYDEESIAARKDTREKNGGSQTVFSEEEWTGVPTMRKGILIDVKPRK